MVDFFFKLCDIQRDLLILNWIKNYPHICLAYRLFKQYPRQNLSSLGNTVCPVQAVGLCEVCATSFYSLRVTQLTARCLCFLAARQRHHPAVQPAAGGLRQRQDSEEQQLQQICKIVFHFVTQVVLVRMCKPKCLPALCCFFYMCRCT